MSEVRRKIVFVSTLTSVPWGGSELLWGEAAARLLKAGHRVAANVCGWPTRARQLTALQQAGMELMERPQVLFRRGQAVLGPLVNRVNRWKSARWLTQQKADLICASSGSIADDLALLNLVANTGTPFVIVLQSAGESLWPNDERAQNIIALARAARRVFFVSEGNRTLVETQLGVELPNAEVVRNPFGVSREAAPPWPPESEVLRLACVGRLDPDAKGQDILLRVLAAEAWRDRPLEVSFFGKGDKEAGLKRLARRFHLEGRTRFVGHVDNVEKIWATHHALVLPSRFEGLPLAIVEAMICGRPVIVTDVAGNVEVVKDGVTGFVAEAATERHLQAAMARAWAARDQWPSMGQAAAQSIRELVPADPAAVFAQRLLELA